MSMKTTAREPIGHFAPLRSMRIFALVDTDAKILERTGKVVLVGSRFEIYSFVVMSYDNSDKLTIPYDGGYLLAEDIDEECCDLCYRWAALHNELDHAGEQRVERKIQAIINSYCTN